jgi:hypothetical protein
MSYDMKTLHKRTMFVGGNTVPIWHCLNKNTGKSEAVRMQGGSLVPFHAVKNQSGESVVDEAKKQAPEKKKELRKKVFMDLQL